MSYSTRVLPCHSDLPIEYTSATRTCDSSVFNTNHPDGIPKSATETNGASIPIQIPSHTEKPSATLSVFRQSAKTGEMISPEDNFFPPRKDDRLLEVGVASDLGRAGTGAN